MPFLGEGGLLGYDASAVAELDLGKAPIAPATAVVDEYVIQFDV